ncbi:MAG: NAD(P)/FAD-dependent oxidoreductase [Actinobacteria bacterium]|nr:NAD(P)/FAD-dependent oxidoreductase [Actinomycetota bacterium]
MAFDAVIIGAGLGGCAAGAAMAGEGKKVLVLERTDKVGGRCSTFEKNGFQMDLGSHAIFRSDYGPFREALRRVGMESKVQFAHIQKVMFKVMGREFKFNMEPVARAIKDIMPAELLKMAGTMLPAMMGVVNTLADQYDDVNVRDFAEKYTDSIWIHNVIDWTSFICFGTPYWETSLGELIRVMLSMTGPALDSISDGTLCMGYPKGGLISFPGALCRGIEKAGGEVRLSTDVKRIAVEGGHVKGVELGSGEFIESDLVLSNGGIKETVKNLVGEEHFEKDYAEYIRSLVPGTAGVCLRLALDEPVVDWELCMSLPPDDVQDYYDHMWNRHEVPEGLPPIMASSPSNMDPSLAPEGKQSVIAIAPVQFGPRENWVKWEAKMLDAIEYTEPGIMEHIMWHDFLNPGFYEIYGEEGSPAIGLAQIVGQAGKSRPSSESPIRGLYYVGAEAGKNVSGIATEMATESGLRCADHVLNSVKV